jgi:hypothetical protein
MLMMMMMMIRYGMHADAAISTVGTLSEDHWKVRLPGIALGALHNHEW